MSSDSKNNTETMSKVKEATNEVLNAMENETKIQLEDLIDRVIAKTGVKISIATYLAPMFARDYPGVEICRGRGGGVYKGGKRVRQDVRPRCAECGQVRRIIGKSV